MHPSRWLPLGAWLAAACSAAAPREPLASHLEDLRGQFEYRALDSTGRLLLTGHVTITPHADSTLTGTWSIDWAADADTEAPVGPQVGTGTLHGHSADGQTFINLNPGWADNNVFLHAAERGTDVVRGGWQWSTFAGMQAAGTFELR